MAHLNVQERRVETKVVYVGPSRSGKTTNLEQLGKRDGGSRLERTEDALSVEYRSRAADGAARFRDCDVMVNVIAPQASIASLSASAADALLSDVDGVVLVLDAAPAAHESNSEAARAVRDAVAAAAAASPARRVPVVVQVNKSDLEGAASADTIAADLDDRWPRVSAIAERGEGVVETIERTLADIVEVLRGGPDGEATAGASARAKASTGGAPSSDARDASATGPRVEGNPLLNALRQLLRDTVTEKVHDLEGQLTRAVIEAMARTVDASVASLRAELDRTRTAAETAQASADAARGAASDLRGFVGGVLQDITRTLAVQTGEVAELHANVQALMARPLPVVAVESSPSAPTPPTATLAHHEALVARIDAVTARVGALDARLREHVTTTAAGLRRTLESLATDTKALDVRADVSALQEDMKGRTDRMLRAIDESSRSLRESAESGSSGHAQSLHTLGEVALDVQTQVHGLVDELKKRRKGWFTGS